MSDHAELVKVLRAHAISTFDGAAVEAFYEAADAIEALEKERDEQKILLNDYLVSINDAIKISGRYGAAKMQAAAAKKVEGWPLAPVTGIFAAEIRAISIEDVLK